MTRIIPKGLIKHLEWTPGQQSPEVLAINPIIQPIKSFSIDALINNGREFYNAERDSKKNFIGVGIALQKAVDNIGLDEVIATIPYLIAGKAFADENNYLWMERYTALSEEDAGIDKNGKLVRKGEAVVVIVHGGGVLTADRIMQVYNKCLTPQFAVKFSEKEFSNLLNGVLPSGESINLYTVDDIKKGIPNPFGKYAVWMPVETAKSKLSGYHVKSDFMNNELVIARAGTLEYLDTYFEKAKHISKNNVGNWHGFKEIDYQQPNGHFLVINGSFGGIEYGHIHTIGRFVGVALGQQGAKE